MPIDDRVGVDRVGGWSSSPCRCAHWVSDAASWLMPGRSSCVNLATYLLLDAFRQNCDTAVVISNDSDLSEPVRIAQAKAGITVGVINPHSAKYRSRRLQGTFFKQLRPNVLGQCQLPTTLHDSEGSITKPKTW